MRELFNVIRLCIGFPVVALGLLLMGKDNCHEMGQRIVASVKKERT